MPSVFDKRPVLTVRIHAGLNAASFLAGLLAVTSATKFMSAQELLEARFPGCGCRLTLEPTQVAHIAGFTCRFETPHEHVHRTPADIAAFYDKSALSQAARRAADAIWSTVAAAEARVHGVPVDAVHFHEVGRLSNMLAVGLIAEAFVALNPADFVVSPIPIGDGTVHCAHGAVPCPAPATLAMLDGVAVVPYAGTGEAVTPTGLAIVRGLGARFGAWPAMRVHAHATAFAPGRVFEDSANGCIFALGF